MKEINEKSFGHMVLQLPEDKDLSDKIIYYLKNIIKVNVEELIGIMWLADLIISCKTTWQCW